MISEKRDLYYDVKKKYRTYGPFKGCMFVRSPKEPTAKLAGFFRRNSITGGHMHYEVFESAAPLHPEEIEAFFEFATDDGARFIVTAQTYNITYQRWEVPFPSEKQIDELMNKIGLYIAREFDLIPEFEPQSDYGKAEALTRFLEDLRAHHKKIVALHGELDTLLRRPGQKKQFIIIYGQRIEATGAAFLKTLQAFRDAETRRGLYEELDLIADSVIKLNEVVNKYETFAGVSTTALDRNGTNKAKADVVRDVSDLARRVYAARLESEGLQDILTSDGWNEAVDKAVFHSQRKLNEFLDRETEHAFGFGFHDARSAQRALHMKLRREIHRQVAKLLVKITSNELIIELAAGPIIRWLERDLIPRLKESLREKGHLPERVERSVKSLESARTRLHSLPPTAKLTDVRRTLAKARGAQNETVFLERDLRRNQAAIARNTTLIDKLEDAKKALKTTITFTTNRFLLNKDDYEDDLKDAVGMVQEILQQLHAAVREVANRSPDENSGEEQTQRLFLQEADLDGVVLPALYEQDDFIPGIHSRVSSLRIYEGDFKSHIPLNERHYGQVFAKSSARVIWWELHLEHTPPAERKAPFTVHFMYTKGNDLFPTFVSSCKTSVAAGSGKSSHTSGYGFKVPGKWTPGIYEVNLLINSNVVAAAVFKITE